MNTAIHLWPQEWVMTPADRKVSVIVENPFGYRMPRRLDLSYRLPVEHQATVSTGCDALASPEMAGSKASCARLGDLTV